jgi:hypothetical protein
MVFDTFRSLHDAIRTDSPEGGHETIQDPCVAKSDLTWNEYHAREANWHFSCVGNKIVAGRQSKVGDSYDKDLYTRKVGNFAIAFLAKADFLCPGRPQEHCYPNEAPEPLLCESDFGVRCTREGDEGIVEVLNTANMVVHRIDDVRHVKIWNASLLPNGRLRLDLGGCTSDL